MQKKYSYVPWCSAILVAVNLVCFLLSCLLGDALYQWGGLSMPGVINGGEYYRIFTAMFLHSGMHHIFNNMVILFFLGAMLEQEIGHLFMGAIYLLSGLGGNLLSLAYKWTQQSSVLSVGASGAIFGMNGLLLAMVLLWPRSLKDVSLPRVLFMVVYSLYSGFSGGSIDNAAHFGGFFTGLILGILLCIYKRIQYIRKEG